MEERINNRIKDINSQIMTLKNAVKIEIERDDFYYANVHLERLLELEKIRYELEHLKED